MSLVPAAAPAPGASPAASPAPSGLDAAVQLLQAGAGPAKPPAAGAPAAAQGGTPGAAPAAEPKKPGEETPDFASRNIAAAMRKERALLDRERTVKAQEGELRALQGQIQQAQRDLDARMKALGESDAQRKARRAEYAKPGGYRLALQDLGLTYEQLTEAVMGGDDGQLPASAVLQTVDERLRQMEQSQQERDAARQRAEEERQRQADEATRQQAAQEAKEAEATVRSEIAAVIQAEPDRFETIAAYGQEAQGLVYRTIEAHFNETGQVMSYADAADKVEAYLTDEVEKLAKTKKWGARFKPREEKPAGGPAPASGSAPAPTLGNVGAAPTPPARGQMSEQQRMDAAVAALTGTRY